VRVVVSKGVGNGQGRGERGRKHTALILHAGGVDKGDIAGPHAHDGCYAGNDADCEEKPECDLLQARELDLVDHGDGDDCEDEIQDQVDGAKGHNVCGTIDAYRMVNHVPSWIRCHPESVDGSAGEQVGNERGDGL
jgi:hypothetical protein